MPTLILGGCCGWQDAAVSTAADGFSMGRKNELFITLLLLVSMPAFADIETAQRASLSVVILDEGLPLSSTIQEMDYPSAITPRHPFTSLSDAVLLYESIQSSGRWQPIAAGPLLQLGDRHPQVSQLKGQLRLLGDLPEPNVQTLASLYFDDELQVALIRFQARHSVKADGVLGPMTRALLNVPPWQRIDQLVLNMYRQHQLPSDEDIYLQVNLPEYRLRLYQQGNVILDMKTVIGKQTRQTPVFSAMLSRLMVNPDWNVPKSIAVEDILPRVQEDADYLAKRNLRVLSGWNVPQIEVAKEDIDITKMYQGKEYYRLWEPPSKRNTLGRLKFQLTADNSIYLHDTPQKYLFNVEKRAFSSGCIRLENARALADALVRLSNQWQPEILDPLFETEDSIKIRLNKPIPVHVTYWTAWLDKDGLLNFANDLYQRDSIDFAEMQNQQQAVMQMD